MADRSMEERLLTAQYKSEVQFYTQRQREEARMTEQEPEQETDLQRMARAMGAPAPGFARGRRPNVSKDNEHDRKLRDVFAN